MADTRRKNVQWNLPDGSTDKPFRWEHPQIAVLMDIRDHLSSIENLMRCHNVSLGFRAMRDLKNHVKNKFPLAKKKRKKHGRGK